MKFELNRKVKKGVKHAKMTPDFKSKAKIEIFHNGNEWEILRLLKNR